MKTSGRGGTTESQMGIKGKEVDGEIDGWLGKVWKKGWKKW